METTNAVLRKRLSTFRTEGGCFKNVSAEVLIELLRSWESWAGSARSFYQEVGLSKTQLGGLMGKAKKLSRSGEFSEAFKEIQVEGPSGVASAQPCVGIELAWDQGKMIRFAQVDQLIDFLKKAA